MACLEIANGLPSSEIVAGPARRSPSATKRRGEPTLTPSDTDTGPSRLVHLVGQAGQREAAELREFLRRNEVPFEWINLTVDPWREFLGGSVQSSELPACLLPNGAVLCLPTLAELSAALGFQTTPKHEHYNVIIAGGGPAGLTAAVYAASEGLTTLLVEQFAPGGQAGTSALIENYPGFPEGISGLELARRTYRQATRFGAEVLIANDLVAAECRPDRPELHVLRLADGSGISADTGVHATGVEYRRLEAPGVEERIGAGVYYGSAPGEAEYYRNKQVFVVGGGNSAGQAVVNLARYAKNVQLLIRGESSAASMSQYLIDDINRLSNVNVRTSTQIVAADGDDCLEALHLEGPSGHSWEEQADALFCFIGMKPRTTWAEDVVITNARGFVVTGAQLPNHPEFEERWPLKRSPDFLETSIPGVFAAGDVRDGSIKRVASAVGDGALAVKQIHTYLADRG